MYSKNNKHLFDINPFYVCLFIVSLLLFGPLLTFVGVSLIAFLNSYTRICIGAILSTLIYCTFGFAGVVMFKVACLYTLFNLFSGSATSDKIIELKQSNEFLCISDDITGIETIGSSITSCCASIKNYCGDQLCRFKNYVNKNYPRVNMLIEIVSNMSLKLFNVCNTIYLVSSDLFYSVHTVLYESKYDIYVSISDYMFVGYMILKFSSALFKMSTLFGKMKKFEDMQSSLLYGRSYKQPTHEETKQMIGCLNETFSVMMSGFGPMNNVYDNSNSMNNFTKMGDEFFTELLKI